MLNLQIDALRGPKRAEAQKRLAELYARHPRELGDPDKALALHEAVVLLDPADDEVRARYLALATKADKRADAARVLSRASNGSKDAAVRARIGVELGDLYRALGDAKKARASFAGVLEAGGDADASLAAARGLDGILTELKERQALAAVLAKLADIEPDDAARVTATERLAVLAEELRDPAGAIHAYTRLVDTPREDAALEALERLLEAAGSHAELASVLKSAARRRTSDRAVAKQLSLRAAEIRTKLGERAPALKAWRSFVQTFGPSREAFARLLPLLEQERAWEELAATVAADADLAPPADRAPIFARLGQLRATRLGDAGGALAAYGRALEADPNERASRLALERAAHRGRSAARRGRRARAIARRESPPTLLARVLEARGAADERASGAARRARRGGRSSRRRLEGHEARARRRRARASRSRSTRRAAARPRASAPSRSVARAHRRVLGRGRRRGAHGGRPPAGARRERAIDSDATLLVARRAGDALVASGDPTASLAVFRAALAYKLVEPGSARARRHAPPRAGEPRRAPVALPRRPPAGR